MIYDFVKVFIDLGSGDICIYDLVDNCVWFKSSGEILIKNGVNIIKLNSVGIEIDFGSNNIVFKSNVIMEKNLMVDGDINMIGSFGDGNVILVGNVVVIGNILDGMGSM